MNVALAIIGLEEEWLATYIENEKPKNLEEMMSLVIRRLYPKEMRTFSMKELHSLKLRVGDRPRELAEKMRSLIRKATPDIKKDAEEILLKSQLIEAAPFSWRSKLYEESGADSERIIAAMELLSESEEYIRKETVC